YTANDGFGRNDQLNFAAHSEDEAEYPAGSYLKKGKQDPMSHRIIEKRRRDRMNNCLADLSRLIPPEYLKKGRGRVEKTEIIEMAIRHLKYLQDRANGKLINSLVGSIPFLLEVIEDWLAFLCLRMKSNCCKRDWGKRIFTLPTVRRARSTSKLGTVKLSARRYDFWWKCEATVLLMDSALPREKLHSHPSSETTSSSSSSHGFISKGVITQAPASVPISFAEPYEEPYPMECDRVSASQIQLADSEVLDSEEPIDGRRNPEPAVRIATDMTRDAPAHCKAYTHKRRRAVKLAPSASTSNSGSTEETRDTSPQDTSSESPHHHHHFEKPPTQYVSVFALNALGKYYVPLSVDYACLSRHLGPYDVLDARAVQHSAPLHPVTIHVNFQSCMNYHVKRERTEEWRNQ
ncbi:putative class b basic helix-loop-helix protein, partial [Operophtera brumata]